MIRKVSTSHLHWKQWWLLVNRSLHSFYTCREYSSYNPDLKINEQATIYVHWPYCSKICTYCNFNKYVSKNVDENRMLSCLIKETETLLKIVGVKQINSVFFGGGTPSLVHPRAIQSYLDCVSTNVHLPADSEVSLEMNPMEMSKLRDFKVSGITRVSVGIQSLNNEDLKLLGREHSDMPDNDTMAELYKTAIEGAESSHNQSYWRGMQYIGIGPGAHGRFMPVDKTQREARVQTLDPKSWMLEVEKFGHGTRKIHTQTKLEQGIRATRNGIMVLDSVTPYLIEVLTTKLEQQSCVSL
ncbi:hypothetical protein KUTeg_003257 [Tegillarca granosa]|uniref:Elp3/MiaA/NifB-like radical SAM core domain-containing protein n=1 Tax=Tegillarca granosa TaxID=220873 RepID=A0ABQ9FN80_TEGGR|nr:hypothetical protein KUTeg_003257 [Tegillarca granosa]